MYLCKRKGFAEHKTIRFILIHMKTKHLFLTAILLVFSMLVVAGPVDPTRALKVAEQFAPQPAKAKRIKSKTTPEQSYEIVYTHRMPNSDRAAFYVVKLGEKGFVIISADDVANPILGYSYTNSWPTSISAEGDTILPPQVLSYLNDMALQIETAIEKYPNLESSEEWNNVGKKAVRKTPARKSADALPDSVGPLLTTTWGQGQYYNALCPEDANGEDGHVPTGCVATAMAQIINYWGQKEEIKTRGIHSYDSQYGNLTVNYDSTSYDFTNMPDALTAESTPEQINAVAKLMYECGVAVNMQYSAWESGSLNQDARAALINFYYFNPDLSIAERAYFSSKDWDRLLQSNIANNQPIYYSGQDFSNGGHAFVCDGYNATGYYHFNFGWEGLADGWYLTSAVSPIGMDFSGNQLVLVGIVPDNTSNVILGQTTGNSIFKVEEPLEFYHLLGHNAYEGTNFKNKCNNHVLFQSADNATQLVLDILEHEDQNVKIYDGEWGAELRSLYVGEINDLSPVVSTNHSLHINYSGNLYYSGFHFVISKNKGCRRVSNIVTSVDTTTVHLTWQENSNATQWEIEYGEKGFALGSRTRVVANATQYDIIGLKKFTEYDIYIRSVCSVNDYGEWNKVSVLSEAPYWTDVVTEQPEGYMVDDAGNITISSAEGLAWLYHILYNEYISNHSMPYNVSLSSNINLGEYMWKAFPRFTGVFDGRGFKIENMYCIDKNFESTALFGSIKDATIKNINLINCYSQQLQYQNAAGIVAGSQGTDTIMNCLVSGKIEGYNSVAPICAFVRKCFIINCVSNCIITSGGTIAGGIAADGLNWPGDKAILRNCYSASSLISLSKACKMSSILGHGCDDLVENCYANVEAYKFVQGETTILNDLSIFCETDSGFHLVEPIFFEQEGVYFTNLKDVLNAGVRKYNLEGLRSWVDDTLGINGNMPILGPEYIVSCPNVQNIVAKNIQNKDGKLGVSLSWEEIGNATQWEVKYNIQDSINEIHRLTTTNNNIEIFGLSESVIYEFCVRPICDDSNKGGWSEKVIIVIDKPYWVDIVTKKPNGYTIDNMGNVYISSAEGLAWLISVVNGLNGMESDDYKGRTIFLTQDINLGKYKWTAITPFYGNFDGQNHTIDGLYINELTDAQGLFGETYNSILQNVIFKNCNISGGSYVGTLAGAGENVTIKCCSSEGKIVARNNYAGGIIGTTRGILGTGPISVISMCSSCGTIRSNNNYAGGITSYAYEMYNCFSSADVSVGQYGAAGLTETLGKKMSNCYSIGDVNGFIYNGGLVAGLDYGASVENCYSISTVTGMGYSVIEGCFDGAVIGTRFGNEKIRYVYGLADFQHHPLVGDVDVNASSNISVISDTASLVMNNTGCAMLTPIVIEGKSYMNLLEALNAWVQEKGNSTYKTWVLDSTTNLPVFGDFYEEQCVKGPNLRVDSIWETGVCIKWETNQEVDTWEVEYGPVNFLLGQGTRFVTNDKSICITGLNLSEKYDIYVRACCDDSIHGTWSKALTILPDKKYWKDVVTQRPEGYKTDIQGNVYIYSAEGLAWLISICNGYNETSESISGVIHLMQDIDISRYKWTALDNIGVFDGHGHTISGLYMCEYEHETYSAFVKTLPTGSVLKNIIFDNVSIKGYYNASIVWDLYGKILNCACSGKLQGVDQTQSHIGGLVGGNSGSIVNCFSNCTISDAYRMGGLIAQNLEVCEILNCYSVCDMESKRGVLAANVAYVNPTPFLAYHLEGVNPVGPYSSHEFVQTYSFTSEEMSCPLTSLVNISGKNNDNLIDALNAWVDANNAEGQYLHWVADTAGVNGGFPIFAEEDTKYIITFCNDDGTILQQDTLELGEMPEYRGEIPIKETEYAKYSFTGWSPALHLATENITYIAQYTEMYEVTFCNWDGSVHYSGIFNYGDWPVCSEEFGEPTRPSDAQYTYTFTGWDSELNVVTGNQSYTAQYEATLNQYEVTFYNWDGSLLQSTMVNYGEMPSYNSATPTREADAQYTYTFTGWNSELNVVTGAQSYTAQYEATLNQYEVTFYDWDGSLLYSEMFDYGEYPVYGEPANPERESDAQYTYTFTGWNSELNVVTGAQSYYAQYEATLNQYEVTFYNWDGTLLQSTMVNYGEMPVYNSATPTREADAQYTYTFTGWGDMSVVTGNQSYTAQYESTLNQYEVTFYNWNGEVLQSSMVNYGEMPVYNSATPTRESDAQYTYTFTGWGDMSVVTGNQSYTAQYEATLNQYEVTFYNWDGSIHYSGIFNYGDWPVCSEEFGEPTRPSDVQFTYTFTGWDSELNVVTGAQSYYAQYEATLNQYEVTFYNWNGEVLQNGMVNYGEMPVYTGVTPTREADVQFTYTFTGWGDMSVVTGNQSYTAQYESTLNQYEVTFYNWDGTLLQSSMVNYGEMPVYTGATPTREADAQYTYTFTGWSPELSEVVDDQEYTAQYDAIENDPTSMDEVSAETIKPRKVLIDEKVYIIVGETIYSAQGQKIR